MLSAVGRGRRKRGQLASDPADQFSQRLCQKVHEGMTGGHLGRDRTEVQVSRRAYWPAWKSDVAAVLKACVPCAQYQRGNPLKKTPLKPLITGDPWERVSIDITGPHPKSSRCHEYILTLIDHFIKWGKLSPSEITQRRQW